MNEEQVAHFLIEKGYHLTALELFTESYERSGAAIESLSEFFEDSANFLMFEDMRSVSEISAGSSEPLSVSNDAIRIKDDRIAVLEHEIKVLHDSLSEAQSALQTKQKSVTLQSPPSNFVGPSADSEDLILKSLILKYMTSRGMKLSALAFGNEISHSKQDERASLPKDVDLVHLLRSYQFDQNSRQRTEELEGLKKEKEHQRETIAQLTIDLDFAKKQLKEVQQKFSQKEEQKKSEEKAQPAQVVKTITVSAEPPSAQLLNEIWKQIPSLLKTLDEKNKGIILQTVGSIYKFHPDRKTRFDSLAQLFTAFPNPNAEQITMLGKILFETNPDEAKVASEILPVATQFLASTSVGTLCLVSRVVSIFAPLSSMDIRTSFLLSIVKQLAEHSSPVVRASVAKDGAALVRLFDITAANKMDDLLPLTKQFIFDQDGTVQSTALEEFAPAVLSLAKLSGHVGSSFCSFWLKLAFSFGLTGSSSLAAVRFKLCIRALELSLPYIIPSIPTPDQQLTPADELAPSSPKVVFINKEELEWAIKSLVPQLTTFSSLLFVPINIRKDADSFVAQTCRQFGAQFSNEHILPSFLIQTESPENDKRLQTVTLLISAVVPYCGSEAFFSQARNFLTYATNELRNFKSRDIQDYISPAFSLLTSRDPKIRTLVFQLLDELSRSSRSAIRTAALSVLSEILPTLEQQEIATNALPIVSRLAEDPDENLLLEVVNCVGSIARFSTVLEVTKRVRALFDKWFKGKIPIRLQSLRVFAVIAGDVEPQIRDTYLIPKLLDIAKDTHSWDDYGAREQAMTLILHIFGSIEELPDDLIQSVAVPLISEFVGCELTAMDPKLPALKRKYLPPEPESKFSLFSKN